MQILDYIPFGKENAVTREDLVVSTGMLDRQIRKAIQKARDDGALILNDCSGNGYYQSDDIKEIYAQYRKDRARALSVLKRLKTMRRMLKERGLPV